MRRQGVRTINETTPQRASLLVCAIPGDPRERLTRGRRWHGTLKNLVASNLNYMPDKAP